MGKSKALPTQDVDKRRLHLSQFRRLPCVKERMRLYLRQYYHHYRKLPRVKKRRRLYMESAKEKVRQNA